MSHSLHFFIVDDDEDIINLVERLLTRAGHRVSSSVTSIDALPKIRAAAPDCVLVDVMMPAMDGFELTALMRGVPELNQTSIVVHSSKPYDSEKKRALSLGANAYMTKPVNPETFVSQLESLLADKVDVQFWGVRGTLPVPGERSLRYGGNTSCMTMRFPKGEFFIFDAGSGIKELSDNLLATHKGKVEARIFISHPHWDHINALPFFVPLYVPGNDFEILGASQGDMSIRDLISAQMDGVYFPITIHEFGASVRFRDLSEEMLTFGEIEIRTMLLNHPGNCLGYRIEYKGRVLCYITDNELYPGDTEFFNERYRNQLIDFVQGCEGMIIDSTYMDEEYPSKIHWGHSRLSEVVNLAHEAKVKTLYLFHHDPGQDDDAIDVKYQTAVNLLNDLGSATTVVAPAEGMRFDL